MSAKWESETFICILSIKQHLACMVRSGDILASVYAVNGGVCMCCLSALLVGMGTVLR